MENRVPSPLNKKIPEYFKISRHLFATFAIFLPQKKNFLFPAYKKVVDSKSSWEILLLYIYFSKRMLYSFEKKNYKTNYNKEMLTYNASIPIINYWWSPIITLKQVGWWLYWWVRRLWSNLSFDVVQFLVWYQTGCVDPKYGL